MVGYAAAAIGDTEIAALLFFQILRAKKFGGIA